MKITKDQLSTIGLWALGLFTAAFAAHTIWEIATDRSPSYRGCGKDGYTLRNADGRWSNCIPCDKDYPIRDPDARFFCTGERRTPEPEKPQLELLGMDDAPGRLRDSTAKSASNLTPPRAPRK